MSKENIYGFPDGLIVITHNDPVEIEKGAQPVHVGLNISKIYGEEAEMLFGSFRMHMKPGRTFNPYLAAVTYKRFFELSGISPLDLLETISEIELSYGFTTLVDH